MILSGIAASQAAEQRCGQLGANCICSEPLQMTGFSSINNAWQNPNDTAGLECGTEVPGGAITRANASDLLGSTDATALGRLPLGSSVQRFLATRPGVSGTLFIGGSHNTSNLGSAYNARMAMRVYVYHSPDYNFRDETPPCHSKFLQGSVGSWHVENAFGDVSMYQFTNPNWGPSTAFPRDCCWAIPGRVGPTFRHEDWKGHWFRVEEIVTNRSGPGVRHLLYMKDVTRGVTPLWNNGAETLIMDWYGTASGPDPWDASFNTRIVSSPSQIPMDLNFYREVSSGGGACNGWRGASHIMYAGWNTDAGQRIGAAVEVEGGGADPAQPQAPRNLRIPEH